MNKVLFVLLALGLSGPLMANDKIVVQINNDISMENYKKDLYLAMHFYKLKNFKEVLKELKKFEKDTAVENPSPSGQATYSYILYRVTMYQAQMAQKQGNKILYLECKDKARDLLDRIQNISDVNDERVNQALGPGHGGAILVAIDEIKPYFDCYDSNERNCDDYFVQPIATPTPEMIPVTVSVELSPKATPVINMGYYEYKNPPGLQVTMNWNPILESTNAATTVIYLPKGSGKRFQIEEEFPKDENASFTLVISQPGSESVTSHGVDCSAGLGCRRAMIDVRAGENISNMLSESSGN